MICNIAMEVMLMKRLQKLLSTLLALALCAALFGTAGAENTKDPQSWQADILQLMDPAKAPRTTTLRFDPQLPAEGAAEKRTYDQELVSSKGDVLNVEFRFALNGIEMGEAQWTTVTDWLKQLVLSSVQYVQADSESLANVIADSYRAQRIAATPGETGMPAWANENLLLTRFSSSLAVILKERR